MILRNYILLFFLFLVSVNSKAQRETFDFDMLNGQAKKIVEKDDGSILAVSDRQYREYPSDTSLYCVQTRFYQSGFIKERGKLIPPHLKFGEWEYFDEDGTLSKKTDEDSRFGSVTLNDIIQFSQKSKYAYKKSLCPIISKDGELIEANSTNISISFDEGSKEWRVRFTDSYFYHEYVVDGNTGKILALLREQTLFFVDDLVDGKVPEKDAGPKKLPVQDNMTIFN
ncbi:hypothetical protein D0T84_14250 [Dysgonomonas sp. 521]|uniref:hypothetical protein n=1 Tax=Dysgonomonas sp. 521 TaxID=2302932 RepID=UPI0013D8DB31|nr:hypothetical protein [Dysgonomonas sp. 521]NDV96065.1 hypothetical protein [Dysgonomonas sp. 521]